MRFLVRWALRLGAWGLIAALALGWFGHVAPPLDSIAHFRLHLVGLAVFAMPALLVADRLRSATALTAVSFVSLALSWPHLPGGGPDLTAVGATRLRIAQLNMRFNNPTPDVLEKRLRDTGADVLLLQEVSRATMRVVRRLEEYPHRHVCDFRDFRGVAVVSRIPFRSIAPCAPDGGMAAVVLAGPHPVTLTSVHTYWPWPWRQWEQLHGIEGQLRDLKPPVVVAGDFNATPWSAAVRFVEDATGTRAVGGLRFTFNTLRLQRGDTRRGGLPIDHVLLPPDMRLTDIRLMRHVGSDHLGTVFEVALP